MDLIRRLRLAVTFTFTVLVIGVIGYVTIEGVRPLDALYMTVITVATVGFREVVDLSDAGKLFTILLIFLGVTTLGYTAATVLEFMLEGHLTGIMERRRMSKELSRLTGHFVVCGYGRVGQEVARSFAAHKAPFVVIDNDHQQIALCTEDGHLCVEGDATDDEVLEAVGVERAKGLIAALDSDADNIFVTLTARQLSKDILVVARADREESEPKLRKAGADRVLTPAVIGGRRMASLALKPLVSEYLDVVMRAENIEYRLEEYEIGELSCLAGATLRSAALRERTGALVIAVHSPQKGFNTNPSPDLVLEAGHRLVVMGTEKQLDALSLIDSECRVISPTETPGA
jgi:voltage-gated potassium channel